MNNDFSEVLGIVAPVPKGEYSSSAYYEYLNIVTYNGSCYIAKQNVHNVAPTNSIYWQYISGGAKIYDTAIDMISDTSLVNGMIVQTLGYNEVNDGGSALYVITDEESGIQEELDNDLYATIIDFKDVKQLGAYKDSTHDDTIVIQNVISNYTGTINDLNSKHNAIVNKNTILLSNLYNTLNNGGIKK